jgi:uncharacterized sulfatase
VYLPHAMPHKPLAASEDFYTPETPDDLYADAIRELDWSVGEINKKLKELGLDEKTLVIFTSDNGPSWGGSTGVFRGMKGTTWEGGIRVPLIARWPGRIPAGMVSDAVSGTIDIFPTLARLAGAEIPADRTIDGRDLLPVLTTPGAESPHEAVFAMVSGQVRIVRSGRWKLHVRAPRASRLSPGYIENSWKKRAPDGTTIIAPAEQPYPTQYPGVQSGDAPKEMMLFDLEADPSEQRDVADSHPEVVRRLKALFDEVDVEVAGPEREYEGMRRVKGGELRYDRFLQ